MKAMHLSRDFRVVFLAAPIGAACVFIAGLGLTVTGCGTAPETMTVGEPVPVVPPLGVMHFVVPDGWVDFSADSLRPASTWLLRRDFALSLTLEEVDAGASMEPRSEEANGGVAEAVHALDSTAAGIASADPLQKQTGRGKYSYWSYVLRLASGEEVRVVLCADPTRMYRCALTRRGTPLQPPDTRTQDEFVSTVIW